MKRIFLHELERRDSYQMLIRIVAPRPIAFVSTLSAKGEGNLAPFSYFNLGGANPPSVVFSVLNDRHGDEKDTLRNVRETGEYTISTVNRAMAERMNLASLAFPRGVNEFAETGFTPVPSDLVKPPRVGESPVSMECRLHVIVPHGDGPLAGHYIIGEVLAVHVEEDLLDAEGRIDPIRPDFIGRMGADWYIHASPEALFEMPRPTETRR